MRIFLTALVLLAAALVYGLTAATGSESGLSDYFWWLAGGSGALTLVLFGILLRYGWLLLRHNMLGSHIARRLASMFALVAVLPGLFLFGVSSRFISYSINSWFGNDTAQALDSSLNLSKAALDMALDNSIRRATGLQVEIISASGLNRPADEVVAASPLRAEFSQLGIYDLSGNRANILYDPQRLPMPQLEAQTRELLSKSGSARFAVAVNGRLYAQGWLMLLQDKVLFFQQPIPENVARDAELIEAARGKYAELTYAKQGLQTFFLMALLVAAFLSVMLALVIALYFALRFIQPVLSLAEGAKAVAQGDFDRRQPVLRNDELGQLTRLFNHMTERLAAARDADETNRQRQEAARHYLETVLESLTAGVVTLDEAGRLKTYNRSAELILALPLAGLAGSSWHTWYRQAARQAQLAELFQAIIQTRDSGRPVQVMYSGADEIRILLGKAIPLSEDNGNGTVLVFDDVTLLVRAQKEAAWGEVAKRLAHEIRNPLTPIQLSAERLAWKLQDKLDEQDAKILTRSTDTIIKQVAAMKEMVDAFRNYARSSSFKMERQDLNRIIEEVLVLYEAGACTFSADLSKIPAIVAADAGAMRQVLHNIFKNAAEAAEAGEKPSVQISSTVADGKITLTVANNGKSFSKEMLLNAFEPYITDKPAGTGLGLPVVKKIIEEHGGSISLANLPSGGAAVTITLSALVED
ncbi:MAG: PAS domain-containing sensor histidine kinase [Neisseria sp.]|nr:PAS domain-containing sensor histidine kinase [Neisseria sp.]